MAEVRTIQVDVVSAEGDIFSGPAEMVFAQGREVARQPPHGDDVERVLHQRDRALGGHACDGQVGRVTDDGTHGGTLRLHSRRTGRLRPGETQLIAQAAAVVPAPGMLWLAANTHELGSLTKLALKGVRTAGRTAAIVEQGGLPPEYPTVAAQPQDRYLQICALRVL